jgi:hypothetical protein
VDHVRADDLVARSAFPGEKPNRERALHAAVRELCLDEGRHGADGGTEVLVLEQDLDGLVELVSIWQWLVASL